MNILYVYAHPNHQSFNHALMKQGVALLQTKHDVIVSDLYANHFNACADWSDFHLAKDTLNQQYFLAQQDAYLKHQLAKDIEAEVNKINQANHIVLQFPLWWFSTPAILKGWFDRVLIKGFAYDAGKVFDQGLLQGKTASIITTTQSPEEAYQMDGVHHATIDTFLKHIHHTLHFVGMKTLKPFVVYNAFNLTDDRKSQIFTDYQTHLQQMFVK